MKPLQKVIIIRKISEELKRHGFSWDEAYYYLKDYDSTVVYHEDYIGGNLDSYIVSSLSSMKEEKLSAMYNELIGEIIPSDTFEQTIMNADCWRSGYYRIFISHLTEDKESAAYLKNQLAKYGIDCFVAHEDITPSKEWEVEIENGLFTMDALCAIVVPEFNGSQWCDQEVGIALGQRKLVISINKGENPYGFFGKFQALKSKSTSADMAAEVWKAISNNDRTKDSYSEKLINLLLNVKNDAECKTLLPILEMYERIDRRHIDNLRNHYSDNALLMDRQNLAMANKVFQKYGFPVIVSQLHTPTSVFDNNDLPF